MSRGYSFETVLFSARCELASGKCECAKASWATMTQNCALSSSSNSGPRNSSCGSAAATNRRLSSRRCSNANRWTSSGELCSDLNMCATRGAVSALLSALAPEKCTNGSVVSDSLTSSATTEIQVTGDDGFCAQELWREKPKAASRAAVLVLDERSASCSRSAVNADGVLTSTECSGGVASAAAENFKASQVSPRLAELPSPRMQLQAVTGVTTASASPDVATPSSTATASPTRKQNYKSIGTLTVSGDDAPKESHVAPSVPTVPVVDAAFGAELVHNGTSGEAPALPREVFLAEDTANNAFHKLAKPSAISALSHGGEDEASDIPMSCIWSEELDCASASPEAPSALSANSAIIAPAISAVCLEAVDRKVVATDPSDIPVARGSGRAACAAVCGPLLAVSVEMDKQNANVGAKERFGELHGEEHGQTHHHSSSTSGGEVQRNENDTSACAPASTPRDHAETGKSQQAHCFPNVHMEERNQTKDTTRNDTAKTTHSTQSSSSSEAVVSADTHKNCKTDERAGRLSDKLRAKFKREFNRSWVDINSAPSWPPIKKTKYLTSDWKIVDLRVGAAQRHEKKKNRLFLNSLCYLFDGVYTQKSTLGRKAGLGLFCERPEGFRKGQIITEFVGWLVDREQAESYRKQRAASHIVAVQKGFLYIDGAKEPTYGMGGGSFANDGSEFLGGPGNNAHFYHWFDDELGRTRVFIRATADIRSGQEIFVPYERTYWVDNFEEQTTYTCLHDAGSTRLKGIAAVFQQTYSALNAKDKITEVMREVTSVEAENCPELFRRKKLEQLRRKIRHVEELQKSRLAANGRQRASCMCAPAKQKSQQRKKEDRKVYERNNKNLPLKRPLSAYMLFSKERRRELLLQHYRPAETQRQTSSSAGRETDSFMTTSLSKNQTSLMQQETGALGRHGIDRPAVLQVRLEDEISAEIICSNSTLEQQVSRPGSRRTTDSSTSVDTTARGIGGLIGPIATADNEEAMGKTRNNHSIQNQTVDVLGDAVGFATAGGLIDSSTSEKEELAVARTRRRSARLTESAATRSLCVDFAAVDETLNVRVEVERAESTTPAKKRMSGELETVETGMTDCGTLSEWKGNRREPTESVVKNGGEGRRRSPRWQQVCCAAHLSAVAVASDEKISGSVNYHEESEEKEVPAGKSRTPIMRADEVVGEMKRAGDSKTRCAGSVERDGTSILGKLSSSHLTESISETTTSCSATASCWKASRSMTIEQEVEMSRVAATDYSAEGTSAERHSRTTRNTPAKPGCEEKVEQKRENKKIEAGGACGAGEFSKFTNADTAGLGRKNAVLQHFASVIRQVANEWTALPAQERRKWERLAAKEKERYLRLRSNNSRRKSRRRDVEQSLRCRKEKLVSDNTREKVQHAYKKKKKPATTAAVAAALTNSSQKIASRKIAPSARGVVTAAATAIDNSLPAEGAEFQGSTETKRSSRKARAHDRATRMRQLVSEVDAHSARGPEKDEEEMEQADIRKRAKENMLERKRCIIRAAKRAAGGAGDRDMPDQKPRFLSKQALEEQRRKAEEVSNAQQTGDQQHHLKTVAAQQARRGTRRGDMTEAGMTYKHGHADSMSRQRQPLVLTYNSVSSVTSCSTTRSSSSRTSSCESRNYRGTDTRRNCRAHGNKRDFPVSSNEKNDASVQFDSVCEMLGGQQCTTEMEQRWAEQHGSVQVLQDQRTRKQDWQPLGKVLDHPGKDQHQQRGRSQQPGAGRYQESCPRKGGVLLCSREHCSRSTRRRSWSPICAAPVHQALPAASRDLSDKETCQTMNEMPADEFLSSSVRRNMLVSPVTHTESTKEEGASVGRRRSSGYSSWNSGGRVEQGSVGGSGRGSRKRDRTHDCSIG